MSQRCEVLYNSVLWNALDVTTLENFQRMDKTFLGDSIPANLEGDALAPVLRENCKLPKLAIDGLRSSSFVAFISKFV